MTSLRVQSFYNSEILDISLSHVLSNQELENYRIFMTSLRVQSFYNSEILDISLSHVLSNQELENR